MKSIVKGPFPGSTIPLAANLREMAEGSRDAVSLNTVALRLERAHHELCIRADDMNVTEFVGVYARALRLLADRDMELKA